jgi:hypothetical protein
MRSSIPARLHKCRECNVAYAVEDHPDPESRGELDSLPDECHVCSGDEFVPVYDRNGTGNGESTAEPTEYSNRARHE